MTYSSLFEDVQNYLERGLDTDPQVYAQIPRLIAMAEKVISTELKPQGFERWVTSTFQAGTAVYNKPNRWRETISITIGTNKLSTDTGYNTRVPLFSRGYQFIRDYWPNQTLTGQPEYYGDYDYQHWIFAPTPALAYPLEVGYWEELAALDDSNQTNWLTQYQPQLLLYQTLLQATPFLKNDERIPVWQGAYDRSAQALLGLDRRKEADASNQREE